MCRILFCSEACTECMLHDVHASHVRHVFSVAALLKPLYSSAIGPIVLTVTI